MKTREHDMVAIMSMLGLHDTWRFFGYKNFYDHTTIYYTEFRWFWDWVPEKGFYRNEYITLNEFIESHKLLHRKL